MSPKPSGMENEYRSFFFFFFYHTIDQYKLRLHFLELKPIQFLKNQYLGLIRDFRFDWILLNNKWCLMTGWLNRTGMVKIKWVLRQNDCLHANSFRINQNLKVPISNSRWRICARLKCLPTADRPPTQTWNEWVTFGDDRVEIGVENVAVDVQRQKKQRDANW